VEHVGVGPKNVPVGIACAIPTFSAIDSGKIERALDVCICVSKIEKQAEQKEFVTLGISFGCVWRANEMCVRWRTQPWQIVCAMILQPEALVNHIIPEIRGMRNIKINRVLAVVEARWKGLHRLCKNNGNQSPFTNVL
jgi:hypothetical protein